MEQHLFSMMSPFTTCITSSLESEAYVLQNWKRGLRVRFLIESEACVLIECESYYLS